MPPINKTDVWVDLQYAVDQMSDNSEDVRDRQVGAADFESQDFEEYTARPLRITELDLAQVRTPVPSADSQPREVPVWRL